MLRAVRFSLVLLLALTIQTTWLADLRPFDVPGDLLLLVAIAGGMAAGPVRGATVGFIAGLALDFVLLTPFGLTALAYLGVGYVVGTVHDGVLRSAPWIPVVVTFVASLAAIIAYVILGQLVGQQFLQTVHRFQLRQRRRTNRQLIALDADVHMPTVRQLSEQ